MILTVMNMIAAVACLAWSADDVRNDEQVLAFVTAYAAVGNLSCVWRDLRHRRRR